MKKATACRKRPCRICKRWFRPDPRVKDRQMTCGNDACKREWHRKRCAEWNRDNSAPIRGERLARKLKVVSGGNWLVKVKDEAPPGTVPVRNAPPTEQLSTFIQEVMVAQLTVMTEYLLRQLLRRVQEVIRRQVIVDTGQSPRHLLNALKI
jgi:hypothetical protein